MATHKGVNRIRIGGLADVVGDVDGEEIAGREEAIDRGQGDVVGVAEVRVYPTKRLDRSIGGCARGGGLGADYAVLAVRLIPDGNDFFAGSFRKNACFELCFGLMSEAVAHSDGKFAKYRHEFSEPFAISPETESRVGDEEDFFSIDGVVAVSEFFGVVASEHRGKVPVGEADALDFFAREMAGTPGDGETALG